MGTLDKMTVTEIVSLIRNRRPDGTFGISFAEARGLIETFGACEAAGARIDATAEAYDKVLARLPRAIA